MGSLYVNSVFHSGLAFGEGVLISENGEVFGNVPDH